MESHPASQTIVDTDPDTDTETKTKSKSSRILLSASLQRATFTLARFTDVLFLPQWQ